jgi:hypothetical protein
MQADLRQSLARYLAVSAVGNLLWEIAQLPLYTLWTQASRGEQAFAILHCTAGDVLIAGCALGVSLILAGTGWPQSRRACVRVGLLTIVLGIAYTIFSEWLNVSVRGSWTYAPEMLKLPWLGTGLSPLVQWLVVPTFAIRAATGYWHWAEWLQMWRDAK